MRSIFQFVKTTVVGGLLVILPLAFVILLMTELTDILDVVSEPFADLFPVDNVLGVSLAVLIEILMILILCFMAGLFVSTGVGSRTTEFVDRKILSNLPGYTAFKGMSRQFAVAGAGDAFVPAIVTWDEETYVIGFVIEESDAGFCTVLVPDAPSPMSGRLYYLKKDRVRILDIPLMEVFDAVSFWGSGYGNLVAKGMPPGATPGETEK